MTQDYRFREQLLAAPLKGMPEVPLKVTTPA
jgi:hypothetical protein